MEQAALRPDYTNHYANFYFDLLENIVSQSRRPPASTAKSDRDNSYTTTRLSSKIWEVFIS